MPFLLERIFELSSPARLSLLLGFCYIIYSLIGALYNVYFHPLSQFPGPKSWIAFPILRHIAAARGLLDERIRTFHEVYGEVVRYAPFEVSFITADAWRDIYGQRHALQNWAFPLLPGDDIRDKNVAGVEGPDHARHRKTLSHAFSEKGLEEQEPLIRAHVNLLIEKLKGIATSKEKTDIMKWYNLTTFDIIGDLAFGAPFDGLKNAKYHDWVGSIFKNVKLFPFLRIAGTYPLIMSLAVWLMPKSLVKAKEKNDRYARDTVLERVNDPKKHGRGDFMDSMLRYQGQKEELSEAELISNGTVLILAGSETTATLLSGVTYWLLRTPAALRKVTDEVRSAFASEDEFTLDNATERLPYLLACLEEGLRKYPPVPSGVPRWTPHGTSTPIAGHQVPPRTIVSVHMSAAFWSPRHFHEAAKFHPERWLSESRNNPSSPFYNDDRAVFRPFSVGPRACLGRNLAYKETRLILAQVLWNFDIDLCEESEHWSEQKAYILWEKPALMCRLRQRAPSK